jgi:hypothetical protein
MAIQSKDIATHSKKIAMKYKKHARNMKNIAMR